MKNLTTKLIFWAQMSFFSIAAANPAIAEATSPLYQNGSTQLQLAEHPLSSGAVDVSLKQPKPIRRLNKGHFSDIWKVRAVAEEHFLKAGYTNRLCYLKLESKTSPTWQIAPYSSLPWYLDNLLIRKVYSIFKQVAVLFRTVFPTSRQSGEKQRAFWGSLSQELPCRSRIKSGQGALTKEDVIQKQIIYPIGPHVNSKILLLYNYAPLRTGGEQLHFLLVPNPTNPARNFLELDKEQYIEVMSLTKKITLWAEKEFGGLATIHFFDKTGAIAGQTQPLYHAHLVIVKKQSEETWGKVAMFFRMLFPTRSLSSKELEKRVTHYKDTLGKSLA